MQPHDHDFDAQLQQRAYQAPSADFAATIIQRAAAIPQRSPVSGWGWVTQLFAEFRLPAPAYSMAGLLLLGILVGTSLPTLDSLNETTAATAQAYEISMAQSAIYYDEEF